MDQLEGLPQKCFCLPHTPRRAPRSDKQKVSWGEGQGGGEGATRKAGRRKASPGQILPNPGLEGRGEGAKQTLSTKVFWAQGECEQKRGLKTLRNSGK